MNAQQRRIYRQMKDGHWHSPAHIAAFTGDPLQSVTARIRDLRKEQCGSHIIERKYVAQNVVLYRMLPQ